jgi:hypothetical protein
MKDIEDENPSLKDVLPKQYRRVPKDVLTALLKTFSEIEIRKIMGTHSVQFMNIFLESSLFLKDRKVASFLRLLFGKADCGNNRAI